MKVLIVDDSLPNLKVLRALLELSDVTALEASDGVDALTALQREPVDAIISDILMPRMDGYRLCYEVRKDRRWRNLPFIFYSATYTSPEDAKLCYDLGADKYIQKPAVSGEILTALREAARNPRKPSGNPPPFSETDVMREYSERLVAKLEARNLELDEANRQVAQAAAELQRANNELDLRVRQRTMELEISVLELEAFSYSVSHDLRAPLRHIGGFADLVLKNGAAQLDETNLHRLNTICDSAQKMTALIDGLLDMSRVSYSGFRRCPVDLTRLALEIASELQAARPETSIDFVVAPGLTAIGDQRLLRVALMNLLGNARKFTSNTSGARVEFAQARDELDAPFFVRDNGAGFDMAYADKLFKAFQRLHAQDEFEGSGIGLATVRRIIHRHGGRIWAQGAPGQGATFFFTLAAERATEPIKTNERAAAQ